MIGIQLETVHWGFGDFNITVDGRNPASGEISPLEGVANIPVIPGVAKMPSISTTGAVGNVRGSGRNKRSGGSGGVCG